MARESLRSPRDAAPRKLSPRLVRRRENTSVGLFKMSGMICLTRVTRRPLCFPNRCQSCRSSCMFLLSVIIGIFGRIEHCNCRCLKRVKNLQYPIRIFRNYLYRVQKMSVYTPRIIDFLLHSEDYATYRNSITRKSARIGNLAATTINNSHVKRE